MILGWVCAPILGSRGAGTVTHFTQKTTQILTKLLQFSALSGAEEDGSGRFGGFWLKMNP